LDTGSSSKACYQDNQFSIPRALRETTSEEQSLIIAKQSERDHHREGSDSGGGIRIKINKEKKVVNHLNPSHENTNLLFYNFNAYRSSSDLEGRGETCGGRVPTRGVRSRKELRQM